MSTFQETTNAKLAQLEQDLSQLRADNTQLKEKNNLLEIQRSGLENELVNSGAQIKSLQGVVQERDVTVITRIPYDSDYSDPTNHANHAN